MRNDYRSQITGVSSDRRRHHNYSQHGLKEKQNEQPHRKGTDRNSYGASESGSKQMSNMSYCRFQNTLCDLQDCADVLEEFSNNGHNVMELERMDAEIAEVKSDPKLDDEERDELLDDLYESRGDLSDKLQGLSSEEYSAALRLLELCAELSEAFDESDLIKENGNDNENTSRSNVTTA